MARYDTLSFWFDSLPEPVEPRPALAGDLDVDVAVVGAGYTGLWTAYYLLEADPALTVAVLEREVAGFGASGRNGGWCSALFAASDARLARVAGPSALADMRQAMRETVDEVGRVAGSEGIDCHYAKGGTVVAARSTAQLERLRAEVSAARSHGIGDDDLRLLTAEETVEVVGATSVLGGTYTPHCAAIHPARLVRGLAEAVVRRGGGLYEQTPVLSIGPACCVTPSGTVRARTVVRATEGYTSGLAGLRRRLAPVYSLMIVTEPLGDDVLDSIGLARRETFADDRHLVIYGQRTADGRIAFGGRGAPYHFGSRTAGRFDQVPSVHAAIRDALVDLFPQLAGVRVTHSWGGPLGVPRDWFPSVGYDRVSGQAWAGGYVGDGVATANLAGRTLADLITGRDTSLTRLPWVGHRSRSWEPEPLRWMGVNAALAAMTAADRAEGRTGRPSRVAGAMSRLLGG